MKVFNSKIKCLLCLFTLFGMVVSCSKEDEINMFQRQTDAMEFNYLKETKELAIASNGNWEVQSKSDWIMVSPSSGNGKSDVEQNIQVSVLHNKGDQRSGLITLSSSEKSFDISIVQSAGHIAIDRPTVASSFLIDQDITGARVLIPYTKGSDEDYVNVRASLQGPGANGLQIQDVVDFQLTAGNGEIPIELSGVTSTSGEIQIDLVVDIPSRNYTQNFTIKTRVKIDGGVDPLESPTVEVVKLLPRMVVLDWGKYIKGSGVSRKFEMELALTQYGSPVRRYSNQADWLSSTSIGTGNHFFDHNRFVFGDLEPSTTYWFRVVHKTINSLNLDSDVTYYQFTTPGESNLGSDVILYKDFDDFWLGGSAIYQAFGVQPTEAQIRAGLDPKSSSAKSSDFRTMSWNNNIASTFSGNLGPANAPLLYNAYWEEVKYGSDFNNSSYAGWYGVNAFAATGAVRLASASAQGSLKTPKLEALTAASTILVTINSAPYFEPYHSWGEDHLRHAIIVEGEGTIVDGGSTVSSIDNDKQITVLCKSNVDPVSKGPLYNYTIPTTHTVRITGATADTRIIISTLPYAGTDHYRIWVDDIKIQKL